MSEQQSAQLEHPVDTAVANAEATPAATAVSAAPTVGRVFVYNGQEYPDPDPALAVDHVRRELARFVPELTNADVREERRADGATQYVFTKRLGTKGAAPDAAGAGPLPGDGAGGARDPRQRPPARADRRDPGDAPGDLSPRARARPPERGVRPRRGGGARRGTGAGRRGGARARRGHRRTPDLLLKLPTA